jgi:hypothetical protein
MRVTLNPHYRTADCRHSEDDVWGCRTCATWELDADLSAIPRRDDEVTLPVSWMVGGPPRNPAVAEEDDYHTWYVSMVSWHPDLGEEANVTLRFRR